MPQRLPKSTAVYQPPLQEIGVKYAEVVACGARFYEEVVRCEPAPSRRRLDALEQLPEVGHRIHEKPFGRWKASRSVVRRVGSRIFGLSRILADADDWFSWLCFYLRRCPEEWAHLVLGAALYTEGGDLRSIESRRCRGTLSCAVLSDQIAEEGRICQPQYVWRHLSAYTNYKGTKAYLHKPHRNTLFGISKPGGNFAQGSCGWFVALAQVGAIKMYQPNGWSAPKHERGRPYKDESGVWRLHATQVIELLTGKRYEPRLQLAPLPPPLPPELLDQIDAELAREEGPDILQGGLGMPEPVNERTALEAAAHDPVTALAAVRARAQTPFEKKKESWKAESLKFESVKNPRQTKEPSSLSEILKTWKPP